MTEVIPLFIGYDLREDQAYEVCKKSAIRRCTQPLHVQPLHQKALRRSHMYYRAPLENTRVDIFDGKPFSTEFTFTRFLVPALMQWDGWAIFVDCDFLFIDDIAKLWELRDESYAVRVVKHHQKPKDSLKMDGIPQTSYGRKNWSSLILWNCSHPSNKLLTVDAVNLEPGAWLHGFGWLRPEEVGELPHGWNFLEGGECKDCLMTPRDALRAIHYTRGGPWFEDYKNVQYADLWNLEASL